MMGGPTADLQAGGDGLGMGEQNRLRDRRGGRRTSLLSPCTGESMGSATSKEGRLVPGADASRWSRRNSGSSLLSASVFSGKWEVRSIAKVRMELSGERTVE